MWSEPQLLLAKISAVTESDCGGIHHYCWESFPRSQPELLLGEASLVAERTTVEGSALLLGDVSQVPQRTCKRIPTYSSENFLRSQKGRLCRNPTLLRGKVSDVTEWTTLWRDPLLLLEKFPKRLVLDPFTVVRSVISMTSEASPRSSSRSRQSFALWHRKLLPRVVWGFSTAVLSLTSGTSPSFLWPRKFPRGLVLGPFTGAFCDLGNISEE